MQCAGLGDHREDDAHRTRQDDEQEVLLPGEVHAHHEEQLDIAATQAGALEHLVHEQGDQQQGHRDDEAVGEGERQRDQQGQRREPPGDADEQREDETVDDADDDEHVGDTLFIEVREGEADEHRAENGHLQCREREPETPEHREEDGGGDELHHQIARRDALAAMTTAPAEREPADHRHEVAPGELVTAGGAVAAPTEHALAMHHTPGRAVDEAAHAGTDDDGEQGEIDDRTDGER